MSLTRKSLEVMGIDENKIDQIIEMHRETVDALKADKEKANEEAKKYKADSEKLAGVEKELADLREKADKPDAYKEKYDKLKSEYDSYKGEVTAKETKAAKSKAYRDMLKEIGISDKRIDSVMKVADLDAIELEDGKIKGVEELKASAKEEWSDFIVSEGVKGAKTPTPPTNTGGGKTKEEIMKIKDSTERQKAIAENHQLFGF